VTLGSLVLLLVALALLVAALLALEILRRRLRAYKADIGYDVRADHCFRFDPAFGRSVDLTIAGDAVELPEFAADEDSAFLELNVRTGLGGLLDDPCLETRQGEVVQRHYVERGGAGRRYFNVSSFMSAAGRAERRLSLRGLRLAFSGPARLHVLRGAVPPEGPLLVLAPHPDDAEIAAFGLLSARPSWVVTVTLGDAGPNLYGAYLPDASVAYVEKARMRAWDSVRIPLLAVPPPVFTANLGYFDGTLARMREAPDSPVTPLYHAQSDISKLRLNPLDRGQPPRDATWRNLVADMRQLLVEVRPTAVALPHPVLDPHPDHHCTTLAFLEALSELPPMPGKLLFYANHLAKTELYPVGPCDGAVSIPPMLDESVPIGTVWSLALDAHTRLRKRIALETHHDLRPLQYQDGRTLAGVIKDALLRPYTYLVQPDVDYVRRAARPNELFFVADFAEASAIRRAVPPPAAGAASSAP
jgi:LmbE family N-acetylglucosaminyl deacetylase